MNLARLTLVWSLAIVGCIGEVTDLDPGASSSQGSGSGMSGPPPMTVMQYLTQVSSKQCAAAYACKATYPTTEPVAFETIYGTSLETCSPTLLASYEPSLIDAEVTAGNIYFNAGAAETCLPRLVAGDCMTFWTNGGVGLSSCREVFHGTASDGDACVVDQDCVNWDSVCDATTSVCTATDTGAE